MAETSPPGVAHWDGPPLSRWRAWTPYEALKLLAGAQVHWCVVGGWAIDLFVGEETRPHADIEIEIPRAEFSAMRAWLRDYKLHVVGDGEVRALAASDFPPPEKHQIWALDERADAWRADVMLAPGDAQTWRCRRDPRIRAPYVSIVAANPQGIPYLKPEGVLLYKAKLAREKDEADFARALPRMDGRARAWLKDALEKAHPGHAWIGRL